MQGLLWGLPGVQAVALVSLPEALGAQSPVPHQQEQPTHAPCVMHTFTCMASALSTRVRALVTGTDASNPKDSLAFHFVPVLKTAAQIPRSLGKAGHTTFPGRLQADRSGNIIFLKTPLGLLQQFLGFAHDLKARQSPCSNPSAF